MVHHGPLSVVNQFEQPYRLLQGTAHALRVKRRAFAITSLNSLLWASTNERLLGFALRDYFWFLVSHFWLLSEAFASLLFFVTHASGTRQMQIIQVVFKSLISR